MEFARAITKADGLTSCLLEGQGILNKIRDMHYNVLQNRPAWGAFGKLSLAFRALFSTVQP